MTKSWLDEMSELEKAATEGPWETVVPSRSGRSWAKGIPTWAKVFKEGELFFEGKIFTALGKGDPRPNIEFIAASRQFVPKAIECIRDILENGCSCHHAGLKCGRCYWTEKWGLE